MKVLSFIIFLFSFTISFCQKNKIDSLINIAQSQKPDTNKVITLINISNKYRVEQINHSLAKKYAEEAIELSKKIKFYKGHFTSTIALAYVTRDMGKHSSGIELLKEAIKIVESNEELKKDKSLTLSWIYTYTALADLYTYLPDYKNAQQYAFKALEKSEQHDKIGIGQCWLTISIILSKQKHVEEAIEYANKALNFFDNNKSYDDLARTYAFLARYSYMQENYQKAIDYYKQSFSTYKKSNSLFGMRIASYNIAEIYLTMRDFDKADFYIQETIRLNNSANDVIYQFYINDLKFKIDFEAKQYNSALETANKLLAFAQNEKNLKNISLAYGNLANVYLALKDTSKAYLFLEKVSTIKDSLYNTEIAKSTNDLVKKYELKSKEEQIAFLNKENRLNKDKIEKESQLLAALNSESLLKEDKLEKELQLKESLIRENNLKQAKLEKETALNKSLANQNALMVANKKDEHLIRWLLIVGSIAFILLGINYYWQYKKEQKTNSIIKQKKEELRLLLSEVHHRVKNNLQIMMSILRMQARKSTNDEVKSILQEAENRLNSMAIVHERLYKNATVANVVLKDYLTELMEVLSQQHHQLIPNFNHIIEDTTDGLILNLDTTVTIGLIVNELVTNSLKYAFGNTSNAEIKIAITNSQNNYQLAISDNGKGIKDDVWKSDTTSSIGLKLVKLFVEQLNGEVIYKANNGSHFIITFSESTKK